ncbi:MAG: hypothetical protein WBN22_05180 [Verrucomicrobiia bacterium]
MDRRMWPASAFSLEPFALACPSAVALQPSAFPHVRPISDHGNVNEIIGKFGGADQLRNAVNQLQSLLYAM